MNKYGYREVRKISAIALRALCIKENWYTCGDNEEYGNLLFNLAGNKDNITTDDIIEIAQDIIDHSGVNAVEEFNNVAFKVANISVTFIEEV